MLYILTLQSPICSPQALFVGQSREGIEKIIATTQSALADDDEPMDTTKPYTLEEYSIDHFRAPKPRTLSGSLRGGIRRIKDSGQLWSFSRVWILGVLYYDTLY